ncbi:MAG: PrsW family intramembrane metalloprotease [Solobacterium sp.]|nr:PrsW family intramembrane metalloprotease [Solobacterium sp.]
MRLPLFTVDAVYVAAAVIPAVFLMLYTYSMDKADKEPAGLLVKLILCGCLAGLPAYLLETVMQDVILPQIPFHSYTAYYAVLAFGIGLIEEGCKYFFLHRVTWDNPAFNYRFDGLIYAVFVSLGFAALENVLYIYSYGLEIFLSRALLAIPAHFAFAVTMGSWYGAAKVQEVRGNHGKMSMNLLLAYLLASAIHGLYDALAMIGTDTAVIAFFAFVAVMYVVIYRKVRTESRTDRFIY